MRAGYFFSMEKEPITVVDNYTLASPVERILALFIDYIVAGVIYTIFFVIFPGFIAALASTVYLIFRDNFRFLGYKSLGKKIFKIEVLKNDSSRISVKTALKRNFVFFTALLNINPGSWFYIAGSITLLFFAIEGYLLITTDDNQRLGDYFADTLVVKE
ncbi:transporter [Sporocytophaga myxococcoides]|uniref:Transporter n=1 Tax=Sporocytophaga myxococcoides TaxID=153721 RepID=A0A098L9N6_9BACT|nr:RDD family protein [Sporocytophaga myxococcoides]GAL83676.1 transporter [Sporocytophaga myxococcoides]